MGQNIGIYRVTENEDHLEYCKINFVEILSEAYRLKGYDEDYPFISCIDPYGNTYFNYLQRFKLVQELRALSKKVSLKGIEEVITFIDKTDKYTYIKFVGD